LLPNGPSNAKGIRASGTGLETRSRLLICFLFILAVNLVPEGDWIPLALLTALLWSAILIGHLSAFQLLRRSLVAIPFLLAAVLIPFVTPGPPLVQVPFAGWTITEPGLTRFAGIVWRFFLSVQAATALTLATPTKDLLAGLSQLKLPSVLVATAAMMHRYLTVIGDEALCMMRARNSRSAVVIGNRRPSWLWQIRVAGLMIGSLFLRSFDRSERIHLAMLSRGFNGTFHGPEPRPLRPFDLAAISGGLAVALLIGLRRWL